jgi:hypothetical protein
MSKAHPIRPSLGESKAARVKAKLDLLGNAAIEYHNCRFESPQVPFGNLIQAALDYARTVRGK